MIAASLERLLALPPGARVLDVGGWAAPVRRADWVIDLMPYETRGMLGSFGEEPERFDSSRWVRTDFCEGRWPFEDDFFDFALCTFTLEDVRDPIHVCAEMSRVARAGYIEVPSIADELTWRNPEVSGGDWLGHSHHRWFCWLEDGTLVFLIKAHSVHSRRSLRVAASSLEFDDRLIAHFWEGSLPAREYPAIDSYPFEILERVASQHRRARPRRALRKRG